MAAEILSCEAREIVELFFQRDLEEEKRLANKDSGADSKSNM